MHEWAMSFNCFNMYFSDNYTEYKKLIAISIAM